MRSKKIVLNVIASIILQVVTMICGFIAPKLFVETFGSNINGAVSSIAQFLSYITLLESGIGGVVRTALFKPLADKDTLGYSKVVKASEKFFKRIACIFVLYAVIIALIFPFITEADLNYISTVALVMIIALSTFSQYYFGISYNLLLLADQKTYVSYMVQIVTTVVNTILIVVLIKFGQSVHIVKLGSGLIFFARPVFLNLYVKKKYNIIKDCEPDHGSLKQKWDALGQHLAYFLHDHTAVVVLTVFSTLNEVSVYSVYHIVTNGLQKIASTFSTGVEAAFGNMVAKGEKESLRTNFKVIELISSIVTITFFTTAGIVVMDFIHIYTKDFTDYNYVRPIFAVILILAGAIKNLRSPYNSMIIAFGLYKETKKFAYMEAILNVVISIILVNVYGLTGIAIGTLVSVTYRTIENARYLYENIFEFSMILYIKRSIINAVNVAVIVLISRFINIQCVNYFWFFVYAIIVAIMALIITFAFSSAFYFKEVRTIFKKLVAIVSNKKV